MAMIPEEARQAIQFGWCETKNLVEWLSVDREKLLTVVSKEIGFEWDSKRYRETAAREKKLSALKQSKIIGSILSSTVKLGDEIYRQLSTHPSDIVREWTAFIVGAKQEITFKKKLAWIKLHADDPNPGVREVAWFALRDQVIDELETAIDSLVPYTGSRSERLRRYASEITRPCGVWAAHIPQLKKTPELCLKILDPLRADTSKYVRDSVANWLNDASKTQADWVREVTDRWLRESPIPETEAIVKRALRTMNKSA